MQPRIGIAIVIAMLLGGCAQQQAMDYARELVSTKADLTLPDADGLTPVQAAIAGGYDEAVVYLLYNGAEVNALGLNGLTPLHAAAVFDRPSIGAMLLKRGAKVSLTSNSQGFTPLHVAARGGKLDMVKLLIEARGNVNATGKRVDTPLTLAASQGHFAVVDYLLSHGAAVNPPVEMPYDSPLDAAIRNKHDRVATLLRANGAKTVSTEE